jgi:hypothetical protein
VAAIFASVAAYFYIIVKTVANTNKIVMSSVIPVLALFGVLWIILWRINDNSGSL